MFFGYIFISHTYSSEHLTQVFVICCCGLTPEALGLPCKHFP
jgi:hypothetical protein